ARISETSALGVSRRGFWVESENGVRRFLAIARAVLLTWERKPDGRSDRFAVRAWLKVLGTRVERIEPATSVLHDPRLQLRPAAAGVPDRFANADELGRWLTARFGAQAAREPEATVRHDTAAFAAATVWVASPAALAQAGARRAPDLIHDLGGDWAALTFGESVSPSTGLAQPGLRGVWRLPGEETDPATLACQLAPLLEKAARLVFDSTETVLAAAVAAELNLPLFTGIVALRDGRVSTVAGDLLGERELPPHAVLVADGSYPKAAGAATKEVIALNVLPPSTRRRSALARWLMRATGKPAGLASARFIVDVGLGVGNEALYKEYVPPLVAAFSAAAGAPVEVGATRKITQELKLLPVDRQIGQTGIAVSPELVIALGISGAPQHMSWLGRDAIVIAINRDPEAPIFSWHRQNPGPRVVACVGNLADWVPALVRCLAPGEGAQSD
ncbi:MAG: FAD-binding protein, partial [Gammaproteobacteria bacterium]|nr:FAD-binding protein [Gammaproteobacteria bacterium]